MTGIRGYGAYVPLYRVERADVAQQHGGYAGSGETAVPAHDENVVTLGVQAAKNALAHADVDGESVDAVFAATTSDPFDERGVAAHVGYAVGAEGDVRTGDFQGSARAATDAVLAARDAVANGRDTALVVAADVLRADPDSDELQTAGAGAGALLLGGEGVGRLADAASHTTGFVGRFKRQGTPVSGDGRFNRKNYLEAVTGAVAGVGADADHAVFPEHDGGWGERAAGAAELDAELHSTFDAVGYAGAGGALLDLAAALDGAAAGETVLLASYGPGGSDALAVDVTADTTPEMTVQEYLDSKEYVTYAKHLSFREPLGGDA
jgi:3-hydroxy-3-methylglutaryl CoA synthase